MAVNKTSSAEVTDMTNTVTNYEVAPGTETGNITYRTDWSKWFGFYQQVPELGSIIDKLALWAVGKGYKADESTTQILKKIKGNGKDTFNTILYNAVKTYKIGGDFFAEIIKDKGKLINLKPINPGTIEVVADKKGMIKEYIQSYGPQKENQQKYKTEQIFHLAWNKTADNIHGTSVIEKITLDNEGNAGLIEMKLEAMKDLKIVFHRYVKPLIIASIDEDDPAEIKKFKAKMDKTVLLGENMVIPKDTVTMERMSIPQYSTLDPLPWIQYLEKQIIKSQGVPDVILGDGEGSTEATAKILYLAFQQLVEWDQLFLEEQIESQLGLKIELEFPASLEEDTEGPQEANKKARKMTNMEMQNGKLE
jgi:hypothetical protein